MFSHVAGRFAVTSARRKFRLDQNRPRRRVKVVFLLQNAESKTSLELGYM